MNKTTLNKTTVLNKSKFWAILFGILLLGYFFLIWSTFKTILSDISLSFGYTDYQYHQRLLEDFIQLKMPFRDYFPIPSHGWFYLLFQSAPYLIFKRTFLADLIIRYLYLPLTGVVLSYIVAKNILRKRSLIFIFLFFCFLFVTNYKFESPRHLIAELSLSLVILFLLKGKIKHLLLGGIIAGLSILTSLEYGVALNITIAGLFIASLFSDVKFKKILFARFFLGEAAILVPFFSWLFLKGVLRNFWDYSFGFVNNFYYASPCAGNSFPRLSDIQTTHSTSSLLVFNIPIEFLMGINFYLVAIFYAISALGLLFLLIVKRKFGKRDLVIFSLVLYGLLIYLRTLDTPCAGYFTYSLVPFFLLMTFLIEKIIRWVRREKILIFKIIGILGVLVFFSWFIMTEDTGYLIKAFGVNKKPSEAASMAKEYYPPAGWFLRTDFVKQYQEITNYILEYTQDKDFVYVYPWGPYSQLTNRRSPTGVNDLLQLQIVGEKLINLTQKELEQKRPKLVVINIYNNLGVAHYGKAREDVSRYFSLGYEDGPVFNGEGNEVEKYILENYKTALKNDLAIVMEPRDIPLELKDKKQEIYSWTPGRPEKIVFQSMRELSPGRYKITGSNASWTLTLENPIKATDVYVELKLDGDFFTKHLTRYFLNLYLSKSGEKGEKLPLTQVVVSKDWQVAKAFLSKPDQTGSITIEVGKNTGLLWWMNPHRLEVKKVEVYSNIQENSRLSVER